MPLNHYNPFQIECGTSPYCCLIRPLISILRPYIWVLHDPDGYVNGEAGMVFKRQLAQTGIEGRVRHVSGGAGPATRSLPSGCQLFTWCTRICERLEDCSARELLCP